MVGTVTKVQKQNLGLFQYIELIPSVSPSQTEEVLVVKVETNQTKNEGSPVDKIR
jgi:cell shape-determining protein MreC